MQSVLDEYSAGKYAAAAALAGSAIQKHPTEFTFYEIRAKALVRSKSDFVELKNISATSSQIARHTYYSLMRGQDCHNSLFELLKIAYSLDSLNIATQIAAFFGEHRVPFAERSFLRARKH